MKHRARKLPASLQEELKRKQPSSSSSPSSLSSSGTPQKLKRQKTSTDVDVADLADRVADLEETLGEVLEQMTHIGRY